MYLLFFTDYILLKGHPFPIFEPTIKTSFWVARILYYCASGIDIYWVYHLYLGINPKPMGVENISEATLIPPPLNNKPIPK